MFSRCCCCQGLTDAPVVRNSYADDPNQGPWPRESMGLFALVDVMPLIELLLSLAPISAASSIRKGSAAAGLALPGLGLLATEGFCWSIEDPSTIGGNWF